MKIVLKLNDSDVECDVSPGETLLQVLQTEGQLPVKKDCESGLCGTCTVLVEDQPVASCVVAALRVHGATVTMPEHVPVGCSVLFGSNKDDATRIGYDTIRWDQDLEPWEAHLIRGQGMGLTGDAFHFAGVEVDSETGEVFVRKAAVVFVSGEKAESATVEVSPESILNAIFEAVGVRLSKIPTIGEDLWHAIMELEEEKEG